MKGKRAIAYSQIAIMIVATFAFAFIVNAQMVGAQGEVWNFPIISGVKNPTGSAGSFGGGADTSGLADTAGNVHGYYGDAGLPLEEVIEGAGGGSGSSLPGWYTSAAAIVKSAFWAAAVYLAVNAIGGYFDKDGEYTNEINALAAGAATAAFYANYLVYTTQATTVWGAEGTLMTMGPWGWVAAAVVALVTWLGSRDKKTKTDTVAFKCYSWQAPIGGHDCEKCNEDENIPCSEYRCKALGQGCGIINAGTSKEKCVWLNPKDASSPGIKPLDGALTDGYEYTDVVERPAGSGGGGVSGMRISKQGGGCIDAFTLVEFGIEASEQAQCKISFKHSTGFKEMGYFIGADNMYKIEHNDKISMPGTQLINSLTPDRESDGEYEFFIRCRDGNGNENKDEFVVGFCVDKGPDLTAPIVKETTIENGAPVQYGVDSAVLGVYINEPASCRWSKKDASYENMENDMSCSNQVWEMNADLLYTCATNLTGITDGQANNYYFRCNDLANNSMQQSYKYVLEGTQPLDIIDVGPTGTIGGSTSTVTATLEVSTDNGHSNGEAICYYSDTGEEESYVEFYDTLSNKHSQDLDLDTGSYKYYIKCVDLGGNTDYAETEFKIIVDTIGANVVRAYEENSKIKVVTDEKAECRYSAEACNFDFAEGIEMPDDGSEINHYAEWKTGQNYYIKCADEYGNMPDPSICSIIVRPSTV